MTQAAQRPHADLRQLHARVSQGRIVVAVPRAERDRDAGGARARDVRAQLTRIAADAAWVRRPQNGIDQDAHLVSAERQ